jgi:hypothetical protein
MNVPIWPGSSSFAPGETPFGFYDYDVDFQRDADKVANFCTRRLGYPLVDIELQDINFYAAFEEAITTYGNEVYAYQIRDNQLDLMGISTDTPLNNSIITPSFQSVVRLSKQYGAEAGSGGNITYYKGSIPLTASIQDYDLKQWALDEGITGGIEIKRVFYEAPPAVVRYFDPYAGTGYGYQALFDSFGFGSFSPAINFLMMPLNYDLQTLQAIELNDMVRRSNYSFEMKNNVLRIFPIPNNSEAKMFFEYIRESERISSQASSNTDGTGGGASNVSNMPYTNPSYIIINSVGRQWIFEYTLAIVKEILGLVRGKYTNIPIPNSEVTLNQQDLLAQAAADKVRLIEKLRQYLDETSRQAGLERKAAEADFALNELSKVPFTIYVG